ncbi:LLM class flavin-dependent oxidoreductase [Pseudofrankia inefficax]|uniref:Luciferase-like, subgroup n=1 Tax=Pseudofrankia inefficax (strain DSM 45817 / CECT 9037 / DDB 130130 / EuI1c) TaxID=298654 RepID=E3JAL8_PSEI1|nr:LLM class flavin-dependent oxidoreductase [Pseudofrankia inefficax]ADP82210.1 Luciferase-like, subgroup [Pseudofrankia inefficax]
MFALRFDMRAPATGAAATELYAAALEMSSWAEARGCVSVLVCEHHMAADGYLPAPLIFASALAARTSTVPIFIAVVILPLRDPIRLAEEMAVLDLVSGGRVSYVAALGYRPAEYEMFGVDFRRRGAIAEEKLDLLLRAKSGAPFEHEGRRIHVTPAPVTPGGPMVMWGGGSQAAARRAGRHGVGFFAQSGDPKLGVAYEQASQEAGHVPGLCILPPPELPMTTFVADDVDQAWDELGPYLLHDAVSYAAWNDPASGTTSLSFAQTVDELRAENRSHRILSVDEAVELVRSGTPLSLHPLVGGLPPDIAWRYLRTVTDTVLPAAGATA